MSTLADLRDVAQARVDNYTAPSGHYAFRTYDRVPGGHGGSLLPEDVLAANLLSLRLSADAVTPLFAEGDGPHQGLLGAMNAALGKLRDVDAFESYSAVDALEETRPLSGERNRATEAVRGWTAVTVSKVLHRHLPHIVPIVDSRVRQFYGLPRASVAKLRASLHADIRANQDWLTGTRTLNHLFTRQVRYQLRHASGRTGCPARLRSLGEALPARLSR